MIVVTTNTGIKQIRYLSRSGAADKVVIYNELKPSDTFDITGNFSTYQIYSTFDLDTDILEDAAYYIFTVLDAAGDVLHYGKIYSTTQSIQDYSVNKSVYVTPTSNNDFITFYE